LVCFYYLFFHNFWFYQESLNTPRNISLSLKINSNLPQGKLKPALGLSSGVMPLDECSAEWWIGLKPVLEVVLC